MINNSVIVGRITKDLELGHTTNGVPFVRFTLAVNRRVSNADGERTADFISCIAWRKTAESLVTYQRKGSLIGVEGRIETGSYDGQDGKRVFTTTVVAESVQFLESRSNNGPSDGVGTQQQSGYQQSQQQNNYQPAGGGQWEAPNQQQYNQQPSYQQQSNQQGYGGNSNNNSSHYSPSMTVSDDDLPF